LCVVRVVVVVVVARTVFIDAGKAVKNEGLSHKLERANEVILISRLILLLKQGDQSFIVGMTVRVIENVLMVEIVV